MFQVGEQVICIAPHEDWGYCAITCPVVGGTYRIRAIDDANGILLEEILNERSWIFNTITSLVEVGEPSFFPERFSPLLRRSTEASFATLDDIRRQVSAPGSGLIPNRETI